VPQRKDLQPELSIETEFEQIVDRIVQWVRGNLPVIGLSAAAVAVVIMALVAGSRARESRQAGVVKDLEEGAVSSDVAPEALREAAERARGTDLHARALLVCANAFFDAGRLAEARKAYEELVAEHGENILASWGRLALAVTLEELAERDRAQEVYQGIADEFQGTFLARRAADRMTALQGGATSRPARNAEKIEGGT